MIQIVIENVCVHQRDCFIEEESTPYTTLINRQTSLLFSVLVSACRLKCLVWLLKGGSPQAALVPVRDPLFSLVSTSSSRISLREHRSLHV